LFLNSLVACGFLLQSACNEPCKGEAGQVQIEIRTVDLESSDSIASMQLTIRVDERERSKSFDLDGKFQDGKTTVTVRLPESAEDRPTKSVTITARVFAQADLGGPVKAQSSRNVTVADDECPSILLELTPVDVEHSDAGIDAGFEMEAGLDAEVLDLGFDLGLDAEFAMDVDGGMQVSADMGFLDAEPEDMGFVDAAMVPQSFLSVNITGTGMGNIVSDPPGIMCPGVVCAASFATGSSVVLRQTPNLGSGFAGWTGACSGANECTVDLNQPTVSAGGEFQLGLAAFYALDGNTNDNSGNAHDGVNQGPATLTSDRNGNAASAYRFSQGDHVDVASSPGLSGFAELTVCAWYTLNSTTANSAFPLYLVSKTFLGDSQGASDAYALSVEQGTRKLLFKVWTTYGGQDRTETVSAEGTTVRNRWTHVCGVYDGTKIYLYVDGQREEDESLRGDINENSSDLRLGNCEGVSTSSYCASSWSLLGKLDNVKIFDRALSGSGISAEYNR